MLSVLTMNNNSNNTEGGRKPGGDGNVYGTDRGDGFTGVYLTPNSPKLTHLICL